MVKETHIIHDFIFLLCRAIDGQKNITKLGGICFLERVLQSKKIKSWIMCVSLTTQRVKAEPGLHAAVSLLYPLLCPSDLYLGLHIYGLISQLFFKLL